MRLLADIAGYTEVELKEKIAADYECDPQEVNKYEIILGYECYGNYEGTSYYLLYDPKDNGLYEVSGGHCSCNGMDGQWDPTPLGSNAPSHWDVNEKVIQAALEEWRQSRGVN